MNPSLHRRDKEAQEEGNWPKAPSKLMDGTGLALNGRVPPPLPCPGRGLQSLGACRTSAGVPVCFPL